MEEIGDVPPVVGAYRILGLIGAGAMGAVLRAEHTIIGRGAAVKILKPEASQNRDIVARFFNEARAATAIKHPGIVEVYDFGHLPNGAAYLVMELLDGQSLRARLAARGRLTESEAFGIVRGIASALAAAHAKGIVHRDIKPDNIFLTPDPEQPSRERVKLLDFGIAKLSGDGGLDGSKTRSGAMMGTPVYMAPEQCRGAGRVDHRADLYSVGCILMELLSGYPPFVEEGIGEIIGAHLFVQPPTLRSRMPGSSDLAEHVVARLLAKNPDHRIQSATELVELMASAGPSSSAVVSGSMWVPGPHDTGVPITTLGAGAYAAAVTRVPARRSRWPWLVGGVGAVGAAISLAVVLSAGKPTAKGGGGGATPALGPGEAPGSVPLDAGASPAPTVALDAAVPPSDAAAPPVDAAAAPPANTVDAGTTTKSAPRPKPKKKRGFLDGL